jgi:hypothetical protein
MRVKSSLGEISVWMAGSTKERHSGHLGECPEDIIFLRIFSQIFQEKQNPIVFRQVAESQALFE